MPYPRYLAWLDTFERLYYDPSQFLTRGLMGKCRWAAHQMRRQFPELLVVEGTVLYDQVFPNGQVARDLEGTHVWCMTPDGRILDPTVRQFERFTNLRYLGCVSP